MGTHRDKEDAIRQAADHVERTRRRLADGRASLDRMHRSLQSTSEHMSSMAAWIDETERHLRTARDAASPDDAAAT